MRNKAPEDRTFVSPALLCLELITMPSAPLHTDLNVPKRIIKPKITYFNSPHMRNSIINILNALMSITSVLSISKFNSLIFLQNIAKLQMHSGVKHGDI